MARPPFTAWGTRDQLLTVSVFVVIFLASALTPMQTDTWWQLRAGQDMWTTRRVLLTDTYSATAHGAFWPNYEWLSEVIYYLAYRLGGLATVTLLATALISAAWALVWRLAPGPVMNKFLLTTPVLPVLSQHWEPRPHAFSFLFLALTVTLLTKRRYRWLPLVFLVWANCHGGVLLGLVVAFVALSVSVASGRDTPRGGVIAFAGCAMPTLLTPLGPRYWTELVTSLIRIRAYPLDEWRPPRLTALSMLPFTIFLVVFLVLAAWALRGLIRNRKAAPVPLMLFGCALTLLPSALMAVRNVGPFIMLAVPAAAAALADRRPAIVTASTERRAANRSLMLCAAAGAVVLVFMAYARTIARLRWQPLPAESIDALRRCSGNLYNRYDEGGYLIWFAPERQVFMDGRQDPYPEPLVREHIEVETTGDYEPLFARYDIRCAYLPVDSPVAERLVTAGWTSMYRDRRWTVLSAR